MKLSCLIKLKIALMSAHLRLENFIYVYTCFNEAGRIPVTLPSPPFYPNHKLRRGAPLLLRLLLRDIDDAIVF